MPSFIWHNSKQKSSQAEPKQGFTWHWCRHVVWKQHVVDVSIGCTAASVTSGHAFGSVIGFVVIIILLIICLTACLVRRTLARRYSGTLLCSWS